jgi:Flp pilus assembly pilin Flp
MNKPVELSEEETKQVAGGATAVEYGLITAGISKVIIAGVQATSANLLTAFAKVQTAIGATKR